MIKFKPNGTTIIVIVFLLMLGLVWYLWDSNDTLKDELSDSKQNISALTDTLKVTKQKNGDLVYSKSILIAKNDDLATLNEDLSDKLTDLEGNILSLTSSIISMELELDTIKNNELINRGGGDFGIKWKTEKDFGDNNLRILSGVTNFSVKTNPLQISPLNTIITRDYFSVSLLTGLRNNDGTLEGFGTSKFPGLKWSQMDTALLRPNTYRSNSNKNKSRFGLSTYSGFGLNYNPWSNEVNHGFQIGAGIRYDLF